MPEVFISISILVRNSPGELGWPGDNRNSGYYLVTDCVPLGRGMLELLLPG